MNFNRKRPVMKRRDFARSPVVFAAGMTLFFILFHVLLSCKAEDARNRGKPARCEIPEERGTNTQQAAREPQPAAQSEEYDFSELSSWNLTVSAWEKLAEKDYKGVMEYTGRCLELYEEKARGKAKEMKGFARPGHEDDYAVVNDVAACHYIMGELYMKQGKNDEAIAQFETVITEYPYALYWDPKGWFWKVAEVSGKNIEKIKTQANADRERG